MRFLIDRAASTRDYDAAPCEEAFRDDYGIWVIDVADLGALLALRDKYGDLILHGGEARITIYDDYVE